MKGFCRFWEAAEGAGLWWWVFAYVAGLFLYGEVGAGEGTVLWLPLIFSAVLFLAAGLGRQRLFQAAVLFSAMSLGLCREAEEERSFRASESLLAFCGGSQVRLVMRVDDLPERSPEQTVFQGEVEWIKKGKNWAPTVGRLRLTVKEALPGVYRGDRVLALVFLHRPKRFVNPGGFDYPAYLWRRGIAVTGYAPSGRFLEVIAAPAGASGILDRWRQNYCEWLLAHGGEGGGLLAALLAGERGALPAETTELFQESGLAHLLSVSGLHLGLVAAAFFFLFDKAVRRRAALVERVPASKAAAGLTAPVVIVYAMLTGLSVPTQRALVMVLAYLLAVMVDRERETWSALALAGGIVLLVWPGARFEVSFLFSFICVAGILYAWPRLTRIISREQSAAEKELSRLERVFGRPLPRRFSRLLAYLGGVLLVSAVALFFIFPLQVKFFHLANPLAPFYNLLAVPTIALLLPAGLLASLVGLVWPGAGGMLTALLGQAAALLAAVCDFLHRHFSLVYPLPAFSWWGTLCWYMGGMGLLEGIFLMRTGMWSRRYFSPSHFRALHLEAVPPAEAPGKQRAAVLVSAGLFFVLSLFDLFRCRDPFPEERMVVAVIDVGQGQAVAVRNGEGRWLLVDGGGSYLSEMDFGRNVVMPCLVSLGVRKLSAVILSHPHPDHAGGLPFILRRLAVEEFWRGPDTDETVEQLDRIARGRGIRIRVLSEGAGEFFFQGFSVRVLHPAGKAGGTADLNEQSLVLVVNDRRGSVLLPGDIGKKTEELLVRKYGGEGGVGPEALSARVLVVPHHGSRHSSGEGFIAAVHPQAALVSAGGSSGLPSPEALGRYERLGIPVWRTDEDGFIALTMSGDTLSLFIPRRNRAEEKQRE